MPRTNDYLGHTTCASSIIRLRVWRERHWPINWYTWVVEALIYWMFLFWDVIFNLPDGSLPPSKYTYIYFFNLNLMNKVKISIRRGNVIPDKT